MLSPSLCVVTLAMIVTGTQAQNFSFPCCGNYLGDYACREYEMNQVTAFRERCITNDMFKFFGCCRQCRVYFDRALGGRGNETRLFTLTTNMTCSTGTRWNRRGDTWCQNFVQLGINDRSCNTTSGYINCRKQCGFCDSLWYNNATIVDDCPVSFPLVSATGRRKRDDSAAGLAANHDSMGGVEFIQELLDEEDAVMKRLMHDASVKAKQIEEKKHD